jgi:hypothetical protein
MPDVVESHDTRVVRIENGRAAIDEAIENLGFRFGDSVDGTKVLYMDRQYIQ